jgi:DNA-binding transcriptional LysR family regulator
MDTLEIEAFLSVVRYGSFTEAAKALFLSQSTLSHRIFELEHKIGMNLIDRGRGLKSLVLTEDGKEFLVIARRWENLIQDTNRLRSRTKKLSLSIGATDTIHNFILPPLYQVLRDTVQNMSIRMKTHNSTELYFQVDRGELDVAFAFLDMPMKNILIERFYKEPRVIIRREPYQKTLCNEIIDKATLDPEMEVFFEGETAFQTWYDFWKGDRGYPDICVDTVQLLLQLLNRDGAWSIVPLSMARKLTLQKCFCYYRLDDPPPERICYKIRSKYPKNSVVESLAILDACLSNFYIESILS